MSKYSEYIVIVASEFANSVEFDNLPKSGADDEQNRYRPLQSEISA